MAEEQSSLFPQPKGGAAKWHLKALAEAKKELTDRVENTTLQYAMQDENKVVHGYYGYSGGSTMQLYEIHINRTAGNVHFAIYLMEPQLIRQL